MWHSKRNLENPTTVSFKEVTKNSDPSILFQTLPLSASELRTCIKSTASDTTRQTAKKVLGVDAMKEAGCIHRLDQALVKEILSNVLMVRVQHYCRLFSYRISHNKVQTQIIDR